MPNNIFGGVYGNYRIDDVIFPVPATAWQEQPIAIGLNGLPINTSYRVHSWNWTNLDGSIARQIFAAFDTQQSAGVAPSELETDPYDASLVDERYGTTVYTDFLIKEISPRARSLPFYDSIVITFEVYVG